MEELKHISPRDYQKSILETAKENNTLVILPTGIGKTLIALMLSIERIKKFPRKKVLILAPTKPLVEQHLESFKKQLPELFAELDIFTGAVNAKKRKEIWRTAEIIFSTPQCIANDVRKGLYNLEEVSLLVIDEAHRCLKNYDYTYVSKAYKEQAKDQRIMGLTASPGSDKDRVSQICENLGVEKLEVRTRDSIDVKPYLQELEFEKHEVPFPQDFIEIRVLLKRIYDSKIAQLKNRNLLFESANKITLLKLQARLASQVSPGNFNAMIGMSLCAQAIKIAHALELLETQTLSGLNEYLKNLQKQAIEKKSKGVQTLVNSPEFKATILSLNKLIEKKIEHPKIETLKKLIEKEFKNKKDSKIMVFAQFRETVSIIAKSLNELKGVNAKTFIGQAKKQHDGVSSGLSQKEQKDAIDKFKSGEINILCATSIGEEGLDIPEVNAVYFYEPIPSEIRRIQRCLPKESKILLADGTSKTMKDLEVGDDVISFNESNAQLEPKRIINKFENGKKELIKITTEKNNWIVSTKNHPFLTLKGWKEADKLNIRDKIALAHSFYTNSNLIYFFDILPKDTYICHPEILKELKNRLNITYQEFTKLMEKDVNKKTLWGYSNIDAIPIEILRKVLNNTEKRLEFIKKIKNIKSRKGKKINIPEKINSDFMWLVGIIASDGDLRVVENIRKNRLIKEKTYKFRICNMNKDILAKAEKIINLFGLQVYKDFNKNTIEANNSIIGKILNEFGLPFGKKSKTLKLTDKFFKLNNEAIEGFLAGFFDGDGSFGKKTKHIRIGTGSKELAFQMQTILLRIGLLSKILTIDKNETRTIKGKIAKFTGDFYSIEIYRRKDVKKFLNFKELIKVKEKIKYKFTKNNHPNIFWVNIKSIQPINEEETYNLEIEDNNTFIADNLIVHNSGRTARLMKGKIAILITKDTRDESHHYAAIAREKKMHRTIETVNKELSIKNAGLSKFL